MPANVVGAQLGQILQSGAGGTDMSMMGRFVQVSPDRLKQIIDDPSGRRGAFRQRAGCPGHAEIDRRDAGTTYGARAADACRIDGGDASGTTRQTRAVPEKHRHGFRTRSRAAKAAMTWRS